MVYHWLAELLEPGPAQDLEYYLFASGSSSQKELEERWDRRCTVEIIRLFVHWFSRYVYILKVCFSLPSALINSQHSQALFLSTEAKYPQLPSNLQILDKAVKPKATYATFNKKMAFLLGSKLYCNLFWWKTCVIDKYFQVLVKRMCFF